MRTAIYTISKNEAHNVKPFIDAAEGCPVYVLDTGSTDETVHLLRSHGANVVEKTISPWRFDAARDEALNLVPENVDVCLSIDMDERIESGWKEKLKLEWSGNIGRTIHIDDWSDEGCTIPATKAKHIRLHSRHGFKWRRPVHELLTPCEGTRPVWCETSILIKHYQRGGPRNYSPILKQMLSADPRNADAWVQLAVECHQKEVFEEALKCYHKFLETTSEAETSTFRYRRSHAWIGIAQCLHRLGKKEEVIRAFLFAIAEEPNCREAWTHFAHVALQIGNAPLAYGAAMSAHNIQHPPNHAAIEAACWGDLPKQIADHAFGVIMETDKGALH